MAGRIAIGEVDQYQRARVGDAGARRLLDVGVADLAVGQVPVRLAPIGDRDEIVTQRRLLADEHQMVGLLGANEPGRSARGFRSSTPGR